MDTPPRPTLPADVPVARTACAVAVSAAHVAVGHTAGDVELFDAATGRRFRKHRPAEGARGTGSIEGLAFSPDGRRLALSNADTVTVVDVESSDVLWQEPLSRAECAHGVDVTWSADGEWLLWPDGDAIARLHLGERRRVRLKLPFALGNGAISLSRDGRLVAYRSNNRAPAVKAHPTRTYVVDLASRRLFAQVDAPAVPGGLRSIRPRFSAVHDDVLWLAHSRLGFLRYDLAAKTLAEAVGMAALEAGGLHEVEMRGDWAAQADVALVAAWPGPLPQPAPSRFFGVVSPASGAVRRVEGGGPATLTADGQALYRVLEDGERLVFRAAALDA